MNEEVWNFVAPGERVDANCYPCSTKWHYGQVYHSPWICPKCGAGNAPWIDRCSCTPLPTPVITCEGN